MSSTLVTSHARIWTHWHSFVQCPQNSVNFFSIKYTVGYGDSLAVSLGISDKYGWFARLIERSLCGTRVLSAHSAKRLYTSRSCSRQNVLLYTLTRCMFTSAVVCPLQATLHTCHWRYVSDGVIVTVRSLVLFYATLCTAVGYVTT